MLFVEKATLYYFVGNFYTDFILGLAYGYNRKEKGYTKNQYFNFEQLQISTTIFTPQIDYICLKCNS